MEIKAILLKQNPQRLRALTIEHSNVGIWGPTLGKKTQCNGKKPSTKTGMVIWFNLESPDFHSAPAHWRSYRCVIIRLGFKEHESNKVSKVIIAYESFFTAIYFPHVPIIKTCVRFPQTIKEAIL